MTADEHNAAGWALLQTPDRSAAQIEEATLHFEAAIAENVEHGPATTNLLDAMLAVGRDAAAVARAEQMIERGEENVSRSRAHNWLGWYHQNKKQDLPRAL